MLWDKNIGNEYNKIGLLQLSGMFILVILLRHLRKAMLSFFPQNEISL